MNSVLHWHWWYQSYRDITIRTSSFNGTAWLLAILVRACFRTRWSHSHQHDCDHGRTCAKRISYVTKKRLPFPWWIYSIFSLFFLQILLVHGKSACCSLGVRFLALFRALELWLTRLYCKPRRTISTYKLENLAPNAQRAHNECQCMFVSVFSIFFLYFIS